MLNSNKTPLRLVIFGVAALVVFSWNAHADQQMKKMMDHGQMLKSPVVKAGDLSIGGAWARMSFGRAVNSAGFMIIENAGTLDDRLVAASSKISKRTELHTHIMDGQIMRMRRVEGGISVPRGGKAKLAPGGYHIMFIGLHKALKNGDTFPLTLHFEHAGEVTLSVTAQKKAMSKDMMDHSKMDHSTMNHGDMKMDPKK